MRRGGWRGLRRERLGRFAYMGIPLRPELEKLVEEDVQRAPPVPDSG